MCHARTYPPSCINHTHAHRQRYRHESNYYKLLYIPQIYTISTCQLKQKYHSMKISMRDNNILCEASCICVTQIIGKPLPHWSLGTTPCVFLKSNFVLSLANLGNRLFSDSLANTCHYGQSIRALALCPTG